LKEAFQRENLVVVKRDDEERKPHFVSSAEEMYFALLAADMMELASKYTRDVDEVHNLFF